MLSVLPCILRFFFFFGGGGGGRRGNGRIWSGGFGFTMLRFCCGEGKGGWSRGGGEGREFCHMHTYTEYLLCEIIASYHTMA